MNKTHVAGAGVATGYFGVLLSLLFPHLPAETVAQLAGALPMVAMGAVAAVETMFPKATPVINAVETTAVQKMGYV